MVALSSVCVETRASEPYQLRSLFTINQILKKEPESARDRGFLFFAFVCVFVVRFFPKFHGGEIPCSVSSSNRILADDVSALNQEVGAVNRSVREFAACA